MFLLLQRFVNPSELIRVLMFLPNCPKEPSSQITSDLILYMNNMHSGGSASFLSRITRHLQPLRLKRPLLGALTLDKYLATIRIPLARRMWRCLSHSLWPCKWHLSLFRIIIINHFSHNQISCFLLRVPDPKLTQVLYLHLRQPDRQFLLLLQLNPTTSQTFQFQVPNLHHLRNLADNVVQGWRKLVNNVHELLRLAIHRYWSPKMLCFVFSIPKKLWVPQVTTRGRMASG